MEKQETYGTKINSTHFFALRLKADCTAKIQHLFLCTIRDSGEPKGIVSNSLK